MCIRDSSGRESGPTALMAAICAAAAPATLSLLAVSQLEARLAALRRTFRILAFMISIEVSGQPLKVSKSSIWDLSCR